MVYKVYKVVVMVMGDNVLLMRGEGVEGRGYTLPLFQKQMLKIRVRRDGLGDVVLR